MRFLSILFLFLFPITEAIAQGEDILSKRISLNIEKESIGVVLQRLEKLTKITFVFDKNKISLDNKVSFNISNKKLAWVLEQLFIETNIDFKVFGTQISLFDNPNKKTPTPAEFTISGYLFDQQTKDPLIGANILEPKTQRGTTTNVEGFYSLSLPKGIHQIICSYTGYQPIATTIDLAKNIDLNFKLTEGTQMQEVVVESSQNGESRHEANTVSSHTMDIETIKSLPTMLGEVDVVKALQLLPGVQSGVEGGNGMFVRGGSPDQNLFLLDGVPVYNANHLFGFVSIFDSKAVKKATLLKGGFPARYAGRLSSVLDISTRNGDMQKFHGDFSVGLLSIGASAEGPIWKNKTSFLVTARRSWVDLYAVPIQEIIVKNNNGNGTIINYSFYDINVKLKHKFSDKNYISLNGYFGDDFFNYKETNKLYFKLGNNDLVKENYNEDKLHWGNKIAALHWHSQLNDQLFMTSSLTYSHYFYQTSTYNSSTLKDLTGKIFANDVFESAAQTPIHDMGFKMNFDYIPHNKHYIKFGIGYTYHLFRPEITKSTFNIQREPPSNDLGSYTGIHEFSAFIEDDIRIGKVLKINLGLHFSDFLLRNQNYYSFQPRLAINILATKHTSIKASYARMTQFVHLLTNPGIGLPTDIWLPTTALVPPEHSHQVSLGFTQDFPFDLEFTAEGFYKKMENLLEYNPTTTVLQNRRSWENLVEIGQGESYGAECMLQRTKGKFTGWVAYTLSWSWRQFENINAGNPFPYRYDRRHDLSLVLNYKINKEFDVGLVWVYGSGHPITLGLERYTPIQNQVDYHNNISTNYSTGAIITEITNIVERNNFRMPDYHRLDIAFNWNKQLKHGSQTWSIGIYNVYNQLNPYMVVPKEQSDGTMKLYQVSILPIMPSISFTRRW